MAQHTRDNPIKQKITTFLCYNDKAEEAAKLYTSLFPNSHIISTVPAPDGQVMLVTFTLAGQTFIALNGGPRFTFSESISLFIECEDQAETDRLWDALTADGGSPVQCGWLQDKFGVRWQIIPKRLMELISDKDPHRAGKAMQAMLTMTKIDISKLEDALRDTP